MVRAAGDAARRPPGDIVGKNRGEKQFAMTAPVTHAAVPAGLEMASPGTRTDAAFTPWRLQRNEIWLRRD